MKEEVLSLALFTSGTASLTPPPGAYHFVYNLPLPVGSQAADVSFPITCIAETSFGQIHATPNTITMIPGARVSLSPNAAGTEWTVTSFIGCSIKPRIA